MFHDYWILLPAIVAVSLVTVYCGGIVDKALQWTRLARSSRANFGDWKFQCDTPGQARTQLEVFHGHVDRAVAALEATQVFIVTTIDHDARIIHYVVDWIQFREVVASKWHAIHMGVGGGDWHTPRVKRSEMMRLVAGEGAHTIRRIDDEHAMVFYSKIN